jgi:hypothetical protein
MATRPREDQGMMENAAGAHAGTTTGWGRLRRYKLVIGLIHLAQAIAMLILSND